MQCNHLAAVKVTHAYDGGAFWADTHFWCWDCWGFAWAFFEPIGAAGGLCIWQEQWLGMLNPNGR